MPTVVKRERVQQLEALGRAKYAAKPEEPAPLPAPGLVEVDRLAATVSSLAEATAKADQSAAIVALLKQQAELIETLRSALARREEWTFTWVDREGNPREMKARQDK